MTGLDQDIVSTALFWSDIHRDARSLSRELSKKPSFDGIIAISRGGLIPAAILARELNIKTVETVCIETYQDEATTQKGQANILKAPDFAKDGTGWLVVDDLVDTGRTAQVVRKMVPNAFFVTLYAKPKGLDQVDLYVRTYEQHVWLFFPWDTELHYSKPISAPLP